MQYIKSKTRQDWAKYLVKLDEVVMKIKVTAHGLKKELNKNLNIILKSSHTSKKKDLWFSHTPNK